MEYFTQREVLSMNVVYICYGVLSPNPFIQICPWEPLHLYAHEII